MREAWAFVRAIWSHWEQGMSGTIGVILASLAATGLITNDKLNRIFWAAAALLMALSMYRTWLAEHRAKKALALALNDEKKARAADIGAHDGGVKLLEARHEAVLVTERDEREKAALALERS